ncbi:hypothetical protein F4775DRAFT_542611 [Biscogniauxia sp. FL1348]|nr:hypothetical protein F4775DRAFT_542611 [Biscogniauxia sp. FL1348]
MVPHLYLRLYPLALLSSRTSYLYNTNIASILFWKHSSVLFTRDKKTEHTLKTKPHQIILNNLPTTKENHYHFLLFLIQLVTPLSPLSQIAFSINQNPTMPLESSQDKGVTGAAKFVTSTVGNTVGGLGRTVGNVTGAATRGVGDTVTSATGSTGKPVGDAIGALGTGVQNGAESVSKGVENAGQWKS